MPRLTRDSQITVGNKEFKVDDLLKTIVYLPAVNVKAFFMEIGLTIPRELRMFVLREVLREKVIETRKSRLTLADELNYRLSWFTEFTETQLENLIVFFDDAKINKDFLEEFWTDLLNYMVDKQVPPKDIKKLLDQSIEYVKKVGLELPDMKTYNRELKDLFFDSFGRIDGLAPQKFRPVLYKSSTLNEIRDLGTKYDVDVPRRLKKSELADIIVHELKDRGQLNDELEKQIRSMSVLVMQRFAIDHDIKASTELKKEEIIEYILANAKETKEAYFIPDSPHVYEKEVEDVAQEIEEENVPEEPVFEEVTIEEESLESVYEESIEDNEEVETIEPVDEPIEVVETVVEEAPKPTKVIEKTTAVSMDISEIVSELRRLREAVEHVVLEEEAPQKQVSEKEVKPIILNSAEFYGTPKSLKEVVKKDEAEERERFIEEKKAASTIGTGKTEEEQDNQLPGEIRFFGKVFKGLGKFLWKLLRVLLKISLILIAVVGVLFILYAALTHFVNIPFLDSFNQTLNGLFGLNILDRAHAILQGIFPQA
ncbi:MAG: hypothetical protein CVV61_02270 [Tenericutes bacterium HGW-Tenericutes-6]|jgi:hypothetical protein|nr:MAG: hypothetical protein CVV61_02270 [Tenericutes bacterium HGW-Tenericutes-6]